MSVGRGDGPGSGVGLGLACGWLARNEYCSGPANSGLRPINAIERQRVTSETNVTVPFFITFPLVVRRASFRGAIPQLSDVFDLGVHGVTPQQTEHKGQVVSEVRHTS